MATATIFVVSSDTATGASVKNLVEAAGLESRTFATFAEFLEAVAPEDRGCLVADVARGELDGIAAQTAFARMPGILLASRGDVTTAVLGLKAGAGNVVEQPYQNKVLLDRIKDGLAASGAIARRRPLPGT